MHGKPFFHLQQGLVLEYGKISLPAVTLNELTVLICDENYINILQWNEIFSTHLIEAHSSILIFMDLFI